MADLDAKGFIRRGNVLVPADFVAEEWLQTIPNGGEVLIDWRKPRHAKNHRHFFAILRLACEHLPDYPDTDSLLDALKIAVNHVRPVMKANGDMIFLPKSINFAALGEEEFKRFKNRALYVLSRILGFDAVSLLPEIDSRNARIQYDFDGDYQRQDRAPPSRQIVDDRPEPPASAYDEEFPE
jgi:hypothetical protein